MEPMNLFDRILLDLTRLTTVVDMGAKTHISLDKKVEAYRLKKELQRIQSKLRTVGTFSIPDAVSSLSPDEKIS